MPKFDKPPLTDDEIYAIEGASNYRINLQEDFMDKGEGSVDDFTKQKQDYFNRMSDQHPNIEKELREALKLPAKYYAGGAVPRSTRRY